jgi:hypothetical protein
MNTFLRNISIFALPLGIVIFVNEFSRIKQNEKNFEFYGISTINSSEELRDACSWICYQRTEYCKKHHVKFLKPYFSKTDSLYYGVIKNLKSSGDYVLANIIFLVFLIPITIFLFIIKIISIKLEIKKLMKWS